MPASSKSQQRLMGMVHAYNKGDLKNPPQVVKDIAKSMKKKDAEDFASTKHKGLPENLEDKDKKKDKKSKKKGGKKAKSQKKSSLLNYLLKLANDLDDNGLIEEADIVESIMSQITLDL